MLAQMRCPGPDMGLKGTVVVYTSRGFDVKYASIDNAFSHLQDDLWEVGISPNFISASEHDPRIEWRIRVVKERVCAIRHTLPFHIIPHLMLRELVKFSVMWINAFPSKGGIPQINPRALMSVVDFDYAKH